MSLRHSARWTQALPGASFLNAVAPQLAHAGILPSGGHYAAGSGTATGSIYLIDTEGVIVSNTGKVTTGGGFVATAAMPGSADKQTGRAIDAGQIIAGGAVRLRGVDVSVFG